MQAFFGAIAAAPVAREARPRSGDGPEQSGAASDEMARAVCAALEQRLDAREQHLDARFLALEHLLNARLAQLAGQVERHEGCTGSVPRGARQGSHIGPGATLPAPSMMASSAGAGRAQLTASDRDASSQKDASVLNGADSGSAAAAPPPSEQ